MFGLNNLKHHINFENGKLECPVAGCLNVYECAPGKAEFFCSDHGIFIHKSTFIYKNSLDNLLWTDSSDIQLLERIAVVKRENRMENNNSEDAVTWNIMRYFDRKALFPAFLSQYSKTDIKSAELILWSWSDKERDPQGWSMLNKARLEFGETIQRGSEPDIIVVTDKILYFIEAKVGAKNETQPSNPSCSKGYCSGGGNLFNELFKADYVTIAVEKEKYELMRYWLLGNWIAKMLKLKFELVSLVVQDAEPDLIEGFGALIQQSDNRKYSRLNWEDIYQYVFQLPDSNDRQLLLDYFKNKSLGYSSNGNIIKAFNH